MIGKQLPLIVDTVDLALDLSIEHYTRICRATKKELQNASPWLLYGTLCGLCEYKRQHAISCADCVLGKKYGRCAEEHKENPWYVTKTKFDNLQDGRCSLRSFRKYVKKMLIILIQIKKELSCTDSEVK